MTVDWRTKEGKKEEKEVNEILSCYFDPMTLCRFLEVRDNIQKPTNWCKLCEMAEMARQLRLISARTS